VHFLRCINTADGDEDRQQEQHHSKEFVLHCLFLICSFLVIVVLKPAAKVQRFFVGMGVFLHQEGIKMRQTTHLTHFSTLTLNS
jgi:hypothetical protein